jgi:hypothetical protein
MHIPWLQRRLYGWQHLALALILGLTAMFYAQTVGYGFLWDDPVWYGHPMGKTWLQALLPTTDFQFYRPLSILYIWFFLRTDGSVAIEYLHALQVGWHLLNVVLVYAIARRLLMSQWAAVAAAALFASYPFLYQAVAWAAPQQPLVAVLQTSAWLTYFIAHPPALDSARHLRTKKQPIMLGCSLILFALSLTVQESSVAVAFVPIMYELLIRQNVKDLASLLDTLKSPRARGWLFSIAYLGMACVYGVLWFMVPRKAGITQLAVDPKTALYLLQSVIYPAIGRSSGYANAPMATVSFLSVAVVVLGGLMILAAQKKRLRLAALALGWIGLSVAPPIVGLEYDYVMLSSRLFYAPALGVVLLWTAAFWPSSHQRVSMRQGWIGPLVLLMIMGQSIRLLAKFALIYERGTSHLNETISVMTQDQSPYLFVNFPDRYQEKQPPYPFGYWGVTLAPVAVDLADFVPLVTGSRAKSMSVSMPWIDTDTRASGPYEIDMRGVIVEPEELYRLAARFDSIYVSRYLPDGGFMLQMAGSFSPRTMDDNCLAKFDGAICLHQVDVVKVEDAYEVSLVWSTGRLLPPHFTIFLHLGHPSQPPLAQADGYTWRGLLPLSEWQPGDLIYERRTLPLLTAADELTMQIGVYDWTDGRRLATRQGEDSLVLPMGSVLSP